METVKEEARKSMETAKEEARESEAPLLLIAHDLSSFGKYLIYNLYENRFRHLNIPELRGWKVLVTSYGWLALLEPESQECCLFNPISMDKIQLPQLPKSVYEYETCILTKPPTEPDCYVVFNDDNFYQCFCRIGDEEFTTVRYGYLGSVASFQGQIYGFFRDKGFVSLHFVGKTVEFRPIQIEMMNGACKPWITKMIYHTWLIESCGELLMVHKVFLTWNVVRFRVSRVDPVRKSCEELVNIGDRTIFLSYYGGGYCCGPSNGIKPNSIYYSNDPRDSNVHVFNLENSSITSLPLPSRCVGRESFISWVDKKTFFS